jgi:membrane protease YdiL (CAAX protease family)
METTGRGGAASDGRVEWRGVGAFLLLTFGVTWGIELAALGGGMRFDGGGTAALALLAGVMFVPGLSAWVVRRFVTREGFATAGLRPGPPRLYALVWAGVPLLFGAVYLATAALGLGRLDLSGESALRELAGPAAQGPPGAALPPAEVLLGVTLAATLTVGLLLTCVATFGEEFGWTGFLLPHLLPLGRWRAALLYGAVWGAWHAPVVWAGYNYPGLGLGGVGLMVLFTSALALVQTGLWLRSGSVLLTTFLHAAVNSQSRGVWPMLVHDVSPALGGSTGLLGIAALAAVGSALLASAPRPAGEG